MGIEFVCIKKDCVYREDGGTCPSDDCAHIGCENCAIGASEKCVGCDVGILGILGEPF